MLILNSFRGDYVRAFACALRFPIARFNRNFKSLRSGFGNLGIWAFGHFDLFLDCISVIPPPPRPPSLARRQHQGIEGADLVLDPNPPQRREEVYSPLGRRESRQPAPLQPHKPWRAVLKFLPRLLLAISLVGKPPAPDPIDSPPHKRFSKMIALESILLAEPHVAVMLSCRTLTRSAKVCRRTLQVAEPKALNLEKGCLAEPWNVGSFRICPLIALSRPDCSPLPLCVRLPQGTSRTAAATASLVVMRLHHVIFKMEKANPRSGQIRETHAMWSIHMRLCARLSRLQCAKSSANATSFMHVKGC